MQLAYGELVSGIYGECISARNITLTLCLSNKIMPTALSIRPSVLDTPVCSVTAEFHRVWYQSLCHSECYGPSVPIK